MADDNDLRRCERVPLDAEIDLRRVKDLRYRSVIRDLSPHGCRVELTERVAHGDLVWVGLPGLETLLSTVCWASEWIAGIEFDHPIHPAVFDHVASRMQQPAF